MSRAFPLLLLMVVPGGPDKPRTDRDLLQGTWQLVSADFDGKPKDGAKDATFVFEGDRLLVKEKGKTETAVVKLDPSKDPKTIDLVTAEGREETAKGIYLLEKDALKLCWALPGQERPGEFTAKKDSGLLFVVLKRARP